jgi:hypothetical protein
METLRIYWRNTKEMPLLLGILCQGGMVVGPIFFVFAVLPIADWTFNGRQMSYSEFWSSGAGLVMVGIIGPMTMGAWGMAARKPNSRWALVLMPLVPVVLTLMFPQLRSTVTLDPLYLLELILSPAIIYGCLFHFSSVRNYFHGERTSA